MIGIKLKMLNIRRYDFFRLFMQIYNQKLKPVIKIYLYVFICLWFKNWFYENYLRGLKA